ncbi:hypothetical protein JW998_03465 [candidate division KSB1 bacterium]|nr:hypothetical protein [candidate division KSB1 bacterium]
MESGILPLINNRKGYCFGRILYMPVPQTEHFPFMAGRPFFIVTFSAFFISRFALHFTQYPTSAMMTPP